MQVVDTSDQFFCEEENKGYLKSLPRLNIHRVNYASAHNYVSTLPANRLDFCKERITCGLKHSERERERKKKKKHAGARVRGKAKEIYPFRG